MADELLDIYDDDFKHIGTMSRKEVHRLGYWHYTFHCWIIIYADNKPHVIFQRRNDTKETNPRKLSVSAAGHILAGESTMDGLREVEEELGIIVSPNELHSMGEYKIVMKKNELFNREISLLFYSIQKKTLNDFKPDLTEISGLYLMSIEDFYHLFHNDIKDICIEGFELNERKEKDFQKKTVTLDDFSKGSSLYYRYISSFFYHHPEFHK